MSGKNTRSDNLASLSVSPAGSGDCISDRFVQELLRRLTVAVPAQTNVGDAVVSISPPEDTSVIWYPADSNGFPQGTAYRYDALQSQWVNTAVVPDPPPCRENSSDNLIKENDDGCWTVSKQEVKALIESLTSFISDDAGNSLRLGSDGGLYVQVSQSVDQGRMELLSTPVSVDEATVAIAPTTVDLGTLISGDIPVWATHAILRAKVELLAEDLASNSTDKSYAEMEVNGNVVASVGANPGTNSTLQYGGTNTDTLFAELNSGEIEYEFTLYESPDWSGPPDSAYFSLEIIGFVRAGIPT